MSASLDDEKLTEEQWNSITTAWLAAAESGQSNRKRGQFIENYCNDHHLPHPNKSSLTRRLKLKQAQQNSTERPHRFFSGCGCLIDEELISLVETKYGNSYKHEGYNENLCMNCNTKLQLPERDYAADAYIEAHMKAKKGVVIDWPDSVLVTPMASAFLRPKLRGCDLLMTCPTFLHFVSQKIRVRKQVLKKNIPTAMWKSCVAGGKHPQFFKYSRGQIAENPDDGSIGLLVFEDTGDFAMVDSSYLDNTTIFTLSEKEMPSIVKLEKGDRQGGAGGRFLFSENRDHDVRSLSPATKHDRLFFTVKTHSSVKLSVAYINHAPQKGGHPKAVLYGSVYNDVFMKRLSWQDKLQDTRKCPFLRERYIAEMKCRLRCFWVMDHFGLTNPNCPHWASFQNALARTNGTVLKQWRACDKKLSYFECVLLEWCCWTGEMRNHQALTAHVDSNKSHSVETMSAFGRLEPEHAHLGKTRQVKLFRDAYLCALWEMVVLRTRCGRDIWHLSFGNTYHLPGRERDRYNITCCHGP